LGTSGSELTDQLHHVLPSPHAIEIPEKLLGHLLDHSSSTIRIPVFALFVSSPSTTHPFSNNVLELLKTSVLHFHADADAKVRNDVLSTTKRLFDRLRGSLQYLTRESERPSKTLKTDLLINSITEEELRENNDVRAIMKQKRKESIQCHSAFLFWYISFIRQELGPTVQYQRHITALKALLILLQSGLDGHVSEQYLSHSSQGDSRWPISASVLDVHMTRLLLDLLLDPFDDVRSGAASVLEMCPTDSKYLLYSSKVYGEFGSNLASNQLRASKNLSNTTPSLDFIKFITRAEEKLLVTGRADHADGVARAYEISFDMESRKQKLLAQGPDVSPGSPLAIGIPESILATLEHALSIASTDLSLAVRTRPVHGHLSGLR
jgi:hypothetical protein